MTVAELIKQLERYDMKQTVRVFDITVEALVDIEEVAENVAGGDVVIWCEDCRGDRMNNKEFTDELFQRMYDYGYRKAEIEGETLFFFVDETKYLRAYSPCVPVKCTCFEERNQLIDVSEYLGVVDWTKVPVDTPVIVWDKCPEISQRRYFAKFKHGQIFTWNEGTTSWSAFSKDACTPWLNGKLAECCNVVGSVDNHERLR